MDWNSFLSAVLGAALSTGALLAVEEGRWRREVKREQFKNRRDATIDLQDALRYAMKATRKLSESQAARSNADPMNDSHVAELMDQAFDTLDQASVLTVRVNDSQLDDLFKRFSVIAVAARFPADVEAYNRWIVDLQQVYQQVTDRIRALLAESPAGHKRAKP